MKAASAMIVKLEFLLFMVGAIGAPPSEAAEGGRDELPDSPVLVARVSITNVPPVFNEQAQRELQAQCDHTYSETSACHYVVPIAGLVRDAPRGATVLVYTRWTDKWWYLQPAYDRFDVMVKGGFAAEISPGTDYAAILVGGRRPKMLGVESTTARDLAHPSNDSDKRRGPPRMFARLPEVGDKLPPFDSPVLAVDVKKGLTERAWQRLEDRRTRRLERARR